MKLVKLPVTELVCINYGHFFFHARYCDKEHSLFLTLYLKGDSLFISHAVSDDNCTISLHTGIKCRESNIEHFKFGESLHHYLQPLLKVGTSLL